MTVASKKDVGWLYITMDDISLMGDMQRTCNLCSHLHDRVNRTLIQSQAARHAQVSTLSDWHYKKLFVLIGGVVQHGMIDKRNYIRMGSTVGGVCQPLNCFDLATKPLPPRPIQNTLKCIFAFKFPGDISHSKDFTLATLSQPSLVD